MVPLTERCLVLWVKDALETQTEISQQCSNIHGNQKPPTTPSTLTLLCRLVQSFPKAPLFISERHQERSDHKRSSVIQSQVQHDSNIRIFYRKGYGAAFSDITPRIQYHPTDTHARPAPTHILEGQTSVKHSEGVSFYWGAIL